MNKKSGAINMSISGIYRLTPTVRIRPGCNEFDVTVVPNKRLESAREKSIFASLL